MPELSERQQAVLAETRVVTVATISPTGFPHLTAVWFVYEEGRFLLSIPSTSAKARNIQNNDKISILVDARDTYAQLGISVQGEAQLVMGAAADEIREKVHAKYIKAAGREDPGIGGFFASMDDAAVLLEPNKWIFWDMAQLDEQVFGGQVKDKQLFYDIVP